MAQTVRKLRHWKQRFNPDAKFVWRKSVTYAGERVELGGPIPVELERDRNKLRRFWEAQVIELLEFVDPNVVTGQVVERSAGPEDDGEGKSAATGGGGEERSAILDDGDGDWLY